MTKKIVKRIGIITAAILFLLIAGFLYRTFFRPTYAGNGNISGILVFGLLTGIVIAWLLFQLWNIRKTQSGTVTASHTVVEGIKRVFKIVVAEGQLNEIYNYENTKKLLKFIPSTKKALVIVRAQVLIGYDINKCVWEIDEEHKEIRLQDFPKPEILSVDCDFNYYYFEDDLFNVIGRKDLQQIQTLAKEQVRKAALQSGLMKIAADQMKLLLEEVTAANQWAIKNIGLIDDYKVLPEPEEEKKESSEKELPLLKQLNLFDKAFDKFDKAVRFFKS
ncbi:putative membrane protein [Proteiniphilum saccharofermentans]|uniref:Putative membrane protein n=1 Tax=Proteiniphilum saccharofermentans TaxID=1642647 RepID=A0A1R3SYI3_9BACT|nr:DUF4230 domain-containing protein [Proteiniphilum saccharofermentans]SCD20561.1 putative membrane protein [Proteiniphilum saccharofermentans]SFS35510.1 Protein of unknown function [Porphyromonadaceae bacterium NLAE-zl-C104]